MKSFTIRPAGGKTLTLRRDLQKLKIPYCSATEYDDYSQPVVCGYTDLRRKRKDKERKDEIGTLLYNGVPISSVYDKKHKLSSIRGYLYVGGDDFIAIESHRYLLWLLPILLALILLLQLSFCGRTPKDPTDSVRNWTPVIEDDLGEGTTATTTQADLRIDFVGFSSWSVPAGQSEDIPINLHNPDGNPCYFSFRIVLADTGETLYQSNMVPPGKTIRQVDLTHSLDEGTYDGMVYITTNALDDGRSMNHLKFHATIVVS